MKLNFGFICDYASFSENGKLNILGIFKNINGTSVPLVHPQLYIVVNILIDKPGNYKEIIKLVRKEDNTEIITPLEFNLAAPQAADEKKVELGVVGQMNNVKFDKGGEYIFKIILNDEVIGEIPLKISING
jgi:hypothetical protein